MLSSCALVQLIIIIIFIIIIIIIIIIIRGSLASTSNLSCTLLEGMLSFCSRIIEEKSRVVLMNNVLEKPTKN